MFKKYLGLERNVFLLGITSFFNDISSQMVVAIFPAFIVSVLKSGAAALGLVEGIADGFANVVKIYSGYLSDRMQKRKGFVILGYSLSVLSRPFYTVFSSVGGMIGLRVVDRIGKGFREAPRDAIISLSSPKEELGRSFGYHRAMDTAGAIVGPFIAYFILKAFPDRFAYVFMTAFVLGFLAVLTVLFVDDVKGVVRSKLLSVSNFKILSPQIKLYLASLFLLSFGTIPVAILLLKTQSLGLSLASIPLFYAVYNVTYAGLSIVAGNASDKRGPRIVIIVGYLTLIVGYIVIGFANSVSVLVVSFLILGLYQALSDGVSRSYLAQMTSEHERGSAYGLFNAVSGFGALGAGVMGGYLWQVYGPASALAVSSILIVFGILLLLQVKKISENVS